MRPSWIEVDLDAVMRNAGIIAAEVAPALLCAVVKADAYGHGDVPVARAALDGGAAWLAVALVEEGELLREAGIVAPILLLSEPATDDAPTLIRLGLTPTVYTARFLEAVAVAAASANDGPCSIHIKVDTGMHRVGADLAEAMALARTASADSRLELAALWTHFAVADDDAEFTKRQSAALEGVRVSLAEENIEVPMLHAANTAGALNHPDTRFDLVRVGLGIYGLRPAPEVAPQLGLDPAMRVVSRVAMVRQVAEGERPSYGRRRPLPAPGKVVTVPIGYADGVVRRLSQVGGEVLINGRRYPFAGTVTMDQIMVDVGDDPVEVGEEVVLLGRQADEEIPADQWAEWLETINYEIVSAFGPRLPRRHIGRS